MLPRIIQTLRLWRHEVRPTLALALPIMAGMLSQTLMGLVDTIMVGRVGVVPLAASYTRLGVLRKTCGLHVAPPHALQCWKSNSPRLQPSQKGRDTIDQRPGR